MLKNLLVVLEDNATALTPYAISAAKRLEARITVVRPRRDNGGLSDGSLEARLEAAAGNPEARKTRAKESLEAFGAAAAEAGVDAELLLPDDWQDPRRDQLGLFARGFDFTIVGQVEPGRAPTRDDLTGQLLEESGRPVLVVPAIQRDPAAFKHVVVGWDGSAAAARAFGDALAIFERADKVEIVSVTSASTSHALIQGGERLAARLVRGGVQGSFKRLPTDEDPANALLSFVADVGADLMVAGGYGHSRLREALFGGATRTFLSSMTLPLFLSR